MHPADEFQWGIPGIHSRKLQGTGVALPGWGGGGGPAIVVVL